MIYDNVKRVCDEKGISVGKLEKELDLSNGRFASGTKVSRGIRKVQKVADYLGVTIEELLK